MTDVPLRILLIEDDEDDYILTREALEAVGPPGCDIEWVRTYAAVERLLSKATFDVFLIDQHLGSHSGIEILRLIKSSGATGPVIFLTGIGDRATDLAAIQAGAADYLIKGQITPALLERSIQHALLRQQIEDARSQILREQLARTEAEASQKRLAFLARAGEVLTASLEIPETLRTAAELAISWLAEFSTIIVRTRTGAILGVSALAPIATSQGQDRLHFAEFTLPRMPAALSGQLSSGKVLRWDILDAGLLAALVPDADQRAAMVARTPRDALALPLPLRGSTIGSLILLNSASSLRHPSSMELTLAEDLAHRAALAIDNARLYAEAQEAIRTRDEFLSVAAHELRTPVATLRGFAQLALRQLNRRGSLDPERERQVLTQIESQTTRLTTLVSQLLDVSRLESGQLTIETQPADLATIVRNAVEAACMRGVPHRIVCETPPTVAAEVDPLRIEQVLTNLLDNAIKYSPDGGNIFVTLTLPNPETACITIQDQGIGIAAEHLDHIFDRFYQAHDGGNFWGMGLGLYISRQIVQRHGGTMSARSERGKGATFFFELPLKARSGKAVEPATAV
ncbi:MAG: ATP-binding protein [Chloroflexi bacterium]|nr:ATP-binding protein [Chloroflexota bacterium]